MQKQTRRSYTGKFKGEPKAVTLVQSSREGFAEVARSLWLDVTTLQTWQHRTQ